MASKKKNNFQLWRTDKKYIRAVMELPCVGCSNHWDDRCAHHQRGDGSGYGTSNKAPDWQTLPLCHMCHLDIHNQNFYGLRERQEEFILLTRQKLINRGLIDEGEYPKVREYV